MDASNAAGLVSGITELSSSYSNAQADQSVANFKANQLNLNAQVADIQGQSTLQAASQDVGLMGKKIGSEIGTQRAMAASQGVVADTGSAAEIQKSTRVEGALSEETIKSNAWKQAWGFGVEASNDTSEAAMTQLEGKAQSQNTMLTGGMKFLGDIIKGDY